jgi:hypothetical protein
MKLALLFLYLFLCFNVLAQDPCKDIRQQDRMIIRTERPFFMKLKRVDTAKMDKQVLSTMNAAIIKETSPAFFNSIKLKQIRVFDSVVKKYNSIHNDITDGSDYYYAVLYEADVKSNTPFIFRVDFSLKGEIVNNEQLLSCAKSGTIITCDKALSVALADKEAPIANAAEVFFCYHPLHHKIIWQIIGVKPGITNKRFIKIIDGSSGLLIEREVAEVITFPDKIIKDTEIKKQ